MGFADATDRDVLSVSQNALPGLNSCSTGSCSRLLRAKTGCYRIKLVSCEFLACQSDLHSTSLHSHALETVCIVPDKFHMKSIIVSRNETILSYF